MRKVVLVACGLVSSSVAFASSSSPAESTYEHANLSDVEGKIAGECMNRGWTVTNQSSNQVTCQVPMNFGKQLLAEVLLGSRYSTPTVSYMQVSLAQVGDDVRAQAHAWLENQSAFGQVRQTPFTDRKTRASLQAFLNAIGFGVLTTNTPWVAQATQEGSTTPGMSAQDERASNVRFVEQQAAAGHCDLADAVAQNAKDATVTARDEALCHPGQEVLAGLPPVPVADEGNGSKAKATKK